MTCNCKTPVDLKIKKLHVDAILPAYGTEGAAGFDLAIMDDVVIHHQETVLIRLGWACAVPPGYEMQVRPRSGLSLNTGLVLKNSPGTIDCDYRGEVGIIAYNSDYKPLRFKRGDRLAQAVIAPVQACNIIKTDDLDETERGEGGFGSTGVSSEQLVIHYQP
jgi:dUTP pyrophosphatase